MYVSGFFSKERLACLYVYVSVWKWSQAKRLVSEEMHCSLLHCHIDLIFMYITVTYKHTTCVICVCVVFSCVCHNYVMFLWRSYSEKIRSYLLIKHVDHIKQTQTNHKQHTTKTQSQHKPTAQVFVLLLCVVCVLLCVCFVLVIA